MFSALLAVTLVVAAPIPEPKPMPQVEETEGLLQKCVDWLLVEYANKDLPPDWDHHLFIDKGSAERQYEAAREHRAWLKWQIDFDRGTPAARKWESQLPDAEYRVDIWARIVVLRDPVYVYTAQAKSTQIRNRLAELKEILGDQAYYNGALPSPVPLWRFGIYGE